MPRPPLAIGTWGEVRVYVGGRDRNGKPTGYVASANYRNFDGKTRLIHRRGKTKSAAKNNLNDALRERSSVTAEGQLMLLSRFGVAATLWLEKFTKLVESGQRSVTSLETYRKMLNTHVLPALGEVRLGEITTPLLDKHLDRIRSSAGNPTACTCRSVISGVLKLAVRYGAIRINPAREVDNITSVPKKLPRALTLDERNQLLERLESDPKAVRRDLPDLTRFMLATGIRIGEAIAVIWSEVDLDARTVEITSKIVRVKGQGLLRVNIVKGKAGRRLLLLPSWAISMLQQRFLRNPAMNSPIFPDARGGFRDPSNAQRGYREARGTEEFSWLVSHNFRKTTATIIDDAGLPARKAADQLGHAKPSMTQDIYFTRKSLHPDIAQALENTFEDPTP